jgi:predicted ATP-dependent protease
MDALTVSPAQSGLVSAEQLRWECDPAQLGFTSTDEVAPLTTMVGQERALEAIGFGLELDLPGYNLYVVGPYGTGRTTAVRNWVAQVAAHRPAPSDWCYLHNFREPAQPLAVELPAGRARGLADDLNAFVAECLRAIPQIFTAEQLQRRQAAVAQQAQERRETLLSGAQTFAATQGFALEITPMGIATMPLAASGQPYTPEAFNALPPAQQARLRTTGQQVEQRVEETMLTIERLQRETQEALHQLDREAVAVIASALLASLRTRYAELPAITQHLDAIQADLIEHVAEFRPRADEMGAPPALEHYRANPLICNDPADGAPVIFEPNPTYYNLLGRMDYRATMGAMLTNYTLIQAGALHRARGGFLILPARDVFANPFAWQVIKRALLNHEVRIENLGEQLSALPTATLRPQLVPLTTKIIFIGDLPTYLLLLQLDEDFARLFKVKAQFGADMARTPGALHAYAGFISAQVREHGLLPFRNDAVARVCEYSTRLADDQERMTTQFTVIADLAIEATAQARRTGAAQVTRDEVDAALAAQERRLNLPEEEIQRLIDTGAIAIDTRAAVVGQVNGLSVFELGDYSFARPSRITAQAGLGSDGVLNIEREVELSGPAHSKGVLILTGYLLGMYASDLPLALSARLVFEQTYTEVDGDSASSAELYALLSRLADLPLRQDIAVTGSVNQQGVIQAVGAVTRKIEGFYAVCQAQGLTGRQGVLIPATNLRNLVLKPAVAAAVAEGQFYIWAADHIDQGLALLLGQPAGQRQPDGRYPDGTVHARVQQRLAAMATRLATFGEHRASRQRPPRLFASRAARGVVPPL